MQVAHATYVLTADEQIDTMGADPRFILSPLTQWPTALLFLIGAGILVGAVVLLPRNSFVADRLRLLRGKLRNYHDAIPWMLRITLGIALLGSSAEHTLLSPTISITNYLALLEAILGFLLITGLFSAVTPILCAVLYLYGAIRFPELFGNAEFLTASIALLAYGVSKPSLDDLLGLPGGEGSEQGRALVPFLLRVGIGISMLWLAFHEKLLNPHLFAEVVEKYELSRFIHLDAATLTLTVGLTEAALGLAILLGFHTRLAAALSYITLIGTYLYFGEHVTAHITLFGVLAVLFITGNGPYSLENWYAKWKLA